MTNRYQVGGPKAGIIGLQPLPTKTLHETDLECSLPQIPSRVAIVAVVASGASVTGALSRVAGTRTRPSPLPEDDPLPDLEEPEEDLLDLPALLSPLEPLLEVPDELP
ncbi:hypothetical protein ACHAXN_012967 [Cyclotella atomus]